MADRAAARFARNRPPPVSEEGLKRFWEGHSRVALFTYDAELVIRGRLALRGHALRAASAFCGSGLLTAISKKLRITQHATGMPLPRSCRLRSRAFTTPAAFSQSLGFEVEPNV